MQVTWESVEASESTSHFKPQTWIELALFLSVPKSPSEAIEYWHPPANEQSTPALELATVIVYSKEAEASFAANSW